MNRIYKILFILKILKSLNLVYLEKSCNPVPVILSLLQNSPLKRVGKTNYRKTLRFLICAYLGIPEIPEFCKRLILSN